MAYERIITALDYAPSQKSDAMTQPVGKDEDGKLWTAPSGGGTDDFDDLTHRPSYNGAPMTHSTNIPEVRSAAWDGKQDAISDLSTIRTGAGLGATAVQPSAIADMATETWVAAQGYLTEHQSLSGKENKGRITISGVEKTATAHTVTIVTNGVTSSFTLVGVS